MSIKISNANLDCKIDIINMTKNLKFLYMIINTILKINFLKLYAEKV